MRLIPLLMVMYTRLWDAALFCGVKLVGDVEGVAADYAVGVGELGVALAV